ncbi:hypothetical protein K461DRAFT_265009 [Myriangium duriaei CBS 260.36]|uniref:Rhodopsin domain-containing protein n=1 Tax=Myriangium duriaei CBS 260.36 TaxID=1168546 RepID=A0A9P4JDN1_9PEZI|nr:hypothetical protein K461DRAFT_265009 [Myriangium duriaei CBS 260.36]
MSSDDVNPYHNRYYDPIAFDAVCIFVSAVCISLRLYVRYFLVRKVGLDDWLLLAGVSLISWLQLFFVVSCFLDAADWFTLEKQGVPNGLSQFYKIGGIDIFPYLMCEVLTRFAYAVFYLRVIPPELDLRWQRYLIITMVWIYGLWQTANAFLNLFQCGSPANLGNQDAICLSHVVLGALFDTSYYLDAILDWMMALIPVVIVWKSTMTRRAKISVALILLLGCCASVISIAVVIMSKHNATIAPDPTDQRYAIKIDMLATSESLVVIICLSLAALKPLFRKFFDMTTKLTSSAATKSTTDPRSQSIRFIGSNFQAAPMMERGNEES